MRKIKIYELCADSDLVTEFIKYDDHAAIVAQLEAALAEARKDQARYKFVRGMEPEDFGNLSTYCDDFDCQVDDLMKRCKQ